MPTSVMQRAFAGGELAPSLHARADQVKYQTGLRRCRNFVVQRHGGVQNRAGFRFIGACKTTAVTVALHRYVSEIPGQSLLVEVGADYFRFFQNGAPLAVDLGTVPAWDVAVNYVVGDLVKNGGIAYYARVVNVGVAPPAAATWYPFTGTTYELPSPFAPDLPNWVQSGRTVTLTHKDHAPYELVFVSLTSWILRPITTASSAPAPTALVLTAAGAGTRKMGYVVTAGLANTYEESLPSNQAINAGCATPTELAPNVLNWTAAAGAAEYYVYCDPWGNGVYGFIGTSAGATTFRDGGITPDFAVTPPIAVVLFNAVNLYPHVAAYFQQRRFFAYSNAVPDAIYGSRTGFPSNFGISSPLQDDDSISFKLAGNNNNPVRHLVALKDLIVLTGEGEWTVTSGQPQSPLTPSGISADQQTYVGATPPPCGPVIIGNAILYVQARGTVLRDLQFEQQVEGLGGKDLSIFAAHLTEGFTLTEIDYAQTPHSVVWAIRSDGTLLGLTYIREQDVWGWHRHDTGAAGRFEHVCVVPELAEDAVYVIVKRTIGGVTKRYIERLATRVLVTFDTDAFFVDAGLTYTGAPVNNVTGLGHLEGQVVAVVGDGAVIFNGDPTATNAANFTVTAGTLPVVLPAAYATIHAGLAIRYGEIELLDLDAQSDTVIRDKRKLVGSVTLLLDGSSRSFWAGPDSAQLTQYRLEPWEVDADSFTGPVEIGITASFTTNGRVFIRQTDPLPLTILGVIPNLALGG